MAGLLFNWLRVSSPDTSFPAYVRFDILEGASFSSSIAKLVATALLEARVHPLVEQKLASRLTRSKYSKLMKSLTTPTRKLTRRGDFGEILAACCMETLLGFRVPVKKLRYAKMRPNDQPKGIDFIALKLDHAGHLQDICYVESKLRTGTDKNYAVQAHDQLRDICAVASSDFHLFLMNVLADTNDPLLDDFVDFMADTQTCTTRFFLALHADAATWDDAALDNLKALPPTLKPLSVLLFRAKALKDSIKRAFAILGLQESEEDD